MEHILDNPGWNALISGNKHLALGNEQAKHFDKEVAIFVGLRNNSVEDFQSLHNLLPHDGPVGFIADTETEIPAQWKTLRVIRTFQMVYNEPLPPETDFQPVALKAEHVPQMLALTQLTNPGPFASRTIEFGHYYGVFDEDKLVAMTGQRLHIFEYAELSAVCTHPDYLGRGYAKQLLLFHINRVIKAGGIPFLHVRDDNERAIKVYESQSFVTRKYIYFYILMKNK